MIRQFHFVAIALVLSILSRATEAGKQNSDREIAIRFYNNSFLPYEAKIISYPNGADYNNTQTFLLLPFTGKNRSFDVGTKIFLVNQKQIDTVMSGNKLSGKPVLIVSKKDEGKKINLH